MRKINKKLLSIILTLAMVVTMIPMFGVTASAEVVKDTSWYTNHESDTTYILSDTADLEGLASLVNSGIDFAGKTIKLSDGFNDTSALTTPIGDSKYIEASDENASFKGTFNGNGKTVVLSITLGENNYGGMFGYVSGGAIKNINTTGEVRGEALLGGVVGKVENGTINNCHSKVFVNGTAENVGGVVGISINGNIINCSATGIVQSDNSYIGGIVGGFLINVNSKNIAVKIINCNYTGKTVSGTDDVGGIVGVINGCVENDNKAAVMISNCNATCEVKAPSGDAGGILGNTDCSGIEWKITNSYTDVVVQGGGSAGGIVGSGASSNTGTVSDCYSKAIIEGKSYLGGVIGSNNGIVINCSAICDITATNGTADYSNCNGGIAGYNDTSGKIYNCYAAGKITNSFDEANKIGGVVGGNQGEVGNCYASVDLNITGNGANYIGGIVGSGSAANCYYKASTNYNGIGAETGKPADVAGNTTALIDAQMKAKAGETNSNWKSITVDGAVLGNIALVDALNKYAKSEEGKNLGCKTWTQSAFMNQGYPTFGVEKKTGIMQLVIKGIAAISGLKLVKSAIFSPVILKLFKWSTIFKIFK